MVSNIAKEKILMKQFINKTEIQKLMETGVWQNAVDVFELAKTQALDEGKKLFHKDKVSKDRVVKILGINEKEIHRYAQIEREQKKEDAQM